MIFNTTPNKTLTWFRFGFWLWFWLWLLFWKRKIVVSFLQIACHITRNRNFNTTVLIINCGLLMVEPLSTMCRWSRSHAHLAPRSLLPYFDSSSFPIIYSVPYSIYARWRELHHAGEPLPLLASLISQCIQCGHVVCTSLVWLNGMVSLLHALPLINPMSSVWLSLGWSAIWSSLFLKLPSDSLITLISHWSRRFILPAWAGRWSSS